MERAGGLVTLADGPQLDAFARLRVSSPDTIFESNFRNSSQSLLWSSSTATGGTVTNTTNTASMDLSVTTSSGSSAIYQTRRYFPYNAGKSQFIIVTGILGTGQENTRKRIGYFDANDGIFFEQNGTTMYVVQRSSTSGSPVDTAVAQSSWNIDTMDGNGVSRLTFNPNYQNIFAIDLEWLGAGRVRLALVIDGQIIPVHSFNNANSATVQSGPYMRSGTLPVRAEIANTGAAAASSTLKLICTSVMSEGGAQSYGQVLSASRGFTLRTVTTSLVPVVSGRLKSTNLHSAAKLVSAGAWGSTADDLNVVMLINPTLTGATFAASSGTNVEIDTAATALTGGTQISNQFSKATTQSSNTAELALGNALNTWFSASVAGVADIFCLAARCQTGTADVTGYLTWLELP